MLCPAPGRAVSGQRGRGFENLGGTGAAAGKPAVPLYRVVGGLRQRADAAAGRLRGSGILESQVRQYVRDALLACPYIREVDGFSFSKKGSRVEARFTVHTAYEEFTQKTEVSIR